LQAHSYKMIILSKPMLQGFYMTIIDFIIKQLDLCVTKIASQEQLNYISSIPHDDKYIWFSLHDRIFMCDKFL